MRVSVKDRPLLEVLNPNNDDQHAKAGHQNPSHPHLNVENVRSKKISKRGAHSTLRDGGGRAFGGLPSCVDRHCLGSALQEEVEVSSKHENWIPIIFALPWTPFLRSIHSLCGGLPRRFAKNCSKCFGVWSTWLWLRGHGNSLWQATRIELHFLWPPLLTTRPGVSRMQVDLVFTTSVG